MYEVNSQGLLWLKTSVMPEQYLSHHSRKQPGCSFEDLVDYGHKSGGNLGKTVLPWKSSCCEGYVLVRNIYHLQLRR